MKNIAIIMEAIPANIKFHLIAETLYTNHWKNKIQQLSHTYFKGKWVYVDDETEFPIDKNDFYNGKRKQNQFRLF
jgi:hypothetical protein